jgi:hypothetical protein
MLEPFDLYTPGARRLYTFEAHGETSLLAHEVRRTLDGIAASAPARIEKGALTREEALELAGLWLAIAEDLERGPATLTDKPACSCGCLHEHQVAPNGVRWQHKVGALRAEISARRRGYPAEVDKGRLTMDEAKQQLERLEAVHDLYWRHGFAFDGTLAELRELSVAVLDSNLREPMGEAA